MPSASHQKSRKTLTSIPSTPRVMKFAPHLASSTCPATLHLLDPYHAQLPYLLLKTLLVHKLPSHLPQISPPCLLQSPHQLQCAPLPRMTVPMPCLPPTDLLSSTLLQMQAALVSMLAQSGTPPPPCASQYVVRLD